MRTSFHTEHPPRLLPLLLGLATLLTSMIFGLAGCADKNATVIVPNPSGQGIRIHLNNVSSEFTHLTLDVTEVATGLPVFGSWDGNTVTFDVPNNGAYKWQVFDQNGKLLVSGTAIVSGNTIDIYPDLTGLSGGTGGTGGS